jgi:hypothetical protein
MEKEKVVAGLIAVGVIGGIGLLAYLNSRSDGRRRQQLSGSGEEEEAVRKFEEIQWGRKPRQMLRFPGKRKAPSGMLVSVGDLEAVIYRSEKSGKSEPYVHFFDDPTPVLATSVDGEELHIVGGRARVDKRGIVG